MNESNTQQNTGKPNDEIDIFEFCSRMWGAFKNFLASIKDLIVSIIIFLIRKSLWIVSFALTGMVMGIVLHSISKLVYSSSLEGNTGGIDNSIMIDHINKLDQVKDKPLLLAKYLNINVDQAKSIHSIKACYGIDINRDWKHDYVDFDEKYNPRDTMQRRIPAFLHIKVTVYDESILSVLRKGLFQYINDNVYIQELYRIDRQQKEELVKELEKEISKIDSLQRVRIRKEKTVEKGEMTFNLSSESDYKLFYADILNLYSQKQSIERSLQISDHPIVVIHDFTPLEHEEKPVLKYIIVFGGLMAVLGIICALCWQYRKRIWEMIREDSTK